jgi:hypothetical protein
VADSKTATLVPEASLLGGLSSRSDFCRSNNWVVIQSTNTVGLPISMSHLPLTASVVLRRLNLQSSAGCQAELVPSERGESFGCGCRYDSDRCSSAPSICAFILDF